MISKKHPYSAFIIMGDFNHMKDSALKGYPLKQIVSTVTHHISVIDCIYTNVSTHYKTPEIFPGVGLSHHAVVLCAPKAVRHKKEYTTTQSRTSNMGAKSAFVEALTEVNWTPLYYIPLCVDQYNLFSQIITDLLDTHLPIKTTTRHITDKPWITQRFKDMISCRQDAKRNNNDLLFRLYRNRVNKAAKTLRADYYQQQVEELKTSDPHTWWSKTKQIIGTDRKSSSTGFSNISNNQFAGDNSRMVDEMNIFLHSVSAHLTPLTAESKPQIETVPDEYIITVEAVDKCLMATNTRKAPGPDGIPNWVLADLAAVLSGPICAIFNSSLREGKLPQIWKSANVTPVPKVKLPSSIESDVRPISLTPVLAKHLESLIGNHILESIKDKLDRNQYGGMKGSSTTHALVDMLHHWHTAIHSSESVRILFCDYSKGFDLVDHTILMENFAELGVPPVLLAWLHDFLSERQQRVKLGSDVSKWLQLNGAMPQGSWLGTLCFVVYIQKMRLVPGLWTHKYIDDSTLSEKISLPSDSKLQEAATALEEWSTENKMRLNARKTKEMVIHFRKTPLVLPPITINNAALQRVPHFKILGVWLSDNLKWDYHVDKLVSKASQRIYYLKQLKKSGLSLDDLLCFYCSVVRSVLEYACQSWHPGLTGGHTDRLEQLQKRSLKIMMPDASYELALEISELEPLSKRRQKLCKKFFDKMCHPDHRLNYLLPDERAVQQETRANNTYCEPKWKNKRFKSNFTTYCLLNLQEN